MDYIAELKNIALDIINLTAKYPNMFHTWEDESLPDKKDLDRIGYINKNDSIISLCADIVKSDENENYIQRCRLALDESTEENVSLFIITLDFLPNNNKVETLFQNPESLSADALGAILVDPNTTPHLVHVNTGENAPSRISYSTQDLLSLSDEQLEEIITSIRKTYLYITSKLN